ncbi:hypothetical protein VNO80_20563 [Phaseolus coccineus]|uniref:Uncharacterized protein n=1 Tax=Phaseolus coccineus TaxID=3886 RepID=A0AAN9M0S8_PHACN
MLAWLESEVQNYCKSTSLPICEEEHDGVSDKTSSTSSDSRRGTANADFVPSVADSETLLCRASFRMRLYLHCKTGQIPNKPCPGYNANCGNVDAEYARNPYLGIYGMNPVKLYDPVRFLGSIPPQLNVLHLNYAPNANCVRRRTTIFYVTLREERTIL